MNYHDIKKCDMLNGDGLRVTLWLSGCSHGCQGCQNPQTHNPNSGIPFDKNAEKELFEALSKDYISGITFSGGDPLYHKNINEVNRLIKKIRKEFPNKTIWLYTGYTLEETTKGPEKFEIVTNCDVVVDGEYIETMRDISLQWIGSSNQRVIDMNKLKMAYGA